MSKITFEKMEDGALRQASPEELTRDVAADALRQSMHLIDRLVFVHRLCLLAMVLGVIGFASGLYSVIRGM
jgi:hypothetical protein